MDPALSQEVVKDAAYGLTSSNRTTTVTDMTFTANSASSTTGSAARGLSSALRELRDARDLTIYAVCKQTGLSRSVLEAAEADASNTKTGVVITLAEFYGLPDTSDLIALGEMGPADRQARIAKHTAWLAAQLRRHAA